MKKIIFLTLSVICFTQLKAKTVEFTVNMTGQVKSPNGIHVMGDFQNAAGLGADWTPNTCLMVQDVIDTNLYHFSVNIPAFTKYEYKYINGDQSYEVEVVPLESQVGYNFDDNRWIYIDSLNADTMHLAPIVFSMNCPSGLNMIRFLVDMTSEPYNANGVHVAGSFQGNDPTTERMYSFQNNVFEHISYMTLATYSYQYYNGNTVPSGETVPSACAISGSRNIVLANDIVLPNVCFSSCSTCYPTLVTTKNEVKNIQLIPNPMNNYTNIVMSNFSQPYSVRIVDMTGKLIFQETNITASSFRINRNNLSKGVYHVAITSNDLSLTTTQKLIVE